MIEIIGKIDTWTTARYPSARKKLFGYCELMRKSTATPSASEQPIPVRIINGVADRGHDGQVSLNDQYDIITWVRLTEGPGNTENEDDTWGLKEGGRQSMTLRWIIAHKVELGENFIIELLRDLPDRFVITGYDFVYIGRDVDLDPDHEQVYETELGKTAYERHRFNWNIYALELSVEFILCEVENSP